MKKAVRIVTALFGVFTGIAGIEHGVFEVLQGHMPPVWRGQERGWMYMPGGRRRPEV